MKIQGKRMMSTRSKLINRIILFFLSLVAFLGLAIIIVPPMINLNKTKQKIEEVIFTQTGVKAKINGDVNFSLMGKTTIPNGVISSVEFDFPLLDIFNIEKANISGTIYVNGASLDIEKIVPYKTNIQIIVNDSKIRFLNKEYQIIHADLLKNKVDAFVRTDQHKYEIKSIDNNFIIKNKNNDLILTGELLPNGTARGRIDIKAQNVNRWFEFKTPKIDGKFLITADVFWNGGYGIKFHNISANGVTGSIEFKDDGYKIINLKSKNANYDMSFFMQNPYILKYASFDLDFYGDMTFMNQKINHLKLNTVGSDKQIKINNISADHIHISGGYIDENGAHDVHVAGPLSGLHTTCLFNGTPTNWYCKEYSHGSNITSKFSVNNDVIDADVYSTAIYADMKPFVVTIRKLASRGVVRFYYPDMDGTLYLEKDSYNVVYDRLDNRSLNQVNLNLKFLPSFMKEDTGDFVWVNGVMIFTPNSKEWQLSKHDNYFILRGNNFKQLSKDADFQSVNDLSYVVSGNYKNGNISDFTIEIAGHKFYGNLSGKKITLKTDVLNIDSFTNQSFLDNFEELSFFTNHPILLPFNSNYDIALSAKKLIYKNETYDNFIYSLRKNMQTVSISDSNRGNLLASLNKNNIKYTINIQLNKFDFKEKILPITMPLNISDTTVTAEIKLNTSGMIAHDIIHNTKGTFDVVFDGGQFYGLGFTDFYASAQQLTKTNVEYALDKALRYGITPIKKMHIIGTYDNGDIKTTQPFTLSMPHVDSTGILDITNNELMAKFKFILRGTSAGPEPIDLTINSDDTRKYNFSEIMMHFDPEYMREFVRTHNQF